MRLLDGLVPQFHGGRISGSATVCGLDPFRTPIPRMARRVGLVFQDVEAQSVYGTVEREIAFGPENLGIPRPRMGELVDAALAAMSIEHLRSRRLATLSGGERQRVQLAAVLALEPELIALDEPTSQLDRQGAQAVLAACRSLASNGRAVVLAEHRLDDVLGSADLLIRVEDGRADGPAEPAKMAGRLSSPPPLVELGRALGWDPLPLTVAEARERLRTATHGPGGHGHDAYAPAQAAPRVRHSAAPQTELAWETRRLSIGPAGRPIVADMSLAAARGEVVAIVGANGSGKTTLLRTLAGLLAPVSGEVVRSVDRIAYVPQNPGSLLHLPSLRAEVELTARRLSVTVDPIEVLESFGLAAVADRYPRDLSSGQKQRAALAATLAGRPQLVLLDEPTRGMDLRARRSLGRVIGTLAESGAAVVIATHDIDLAAEVADRVVLLEDGRASGARNPDGGIRRGHGLGDADRPPAPGWAGHGLRRARVPRLDAVGRGGFAMTLILASIVGVALFFWPFFASDLPPDTPALLVTVGTVAVLGLMEAGARRLDSGRLALLAALAAVDAALRLAMVNGFGGFSPIFFLVLAAGYEFGASYGFLVGAYSLLVSAVVTGGVGPWLPYETFAVGWVGAAAGVAGSVVRGVGSRKRFGSGPSVFRGWWPTRIDVAVLVGVAIATGFAYGALTDVWGWVAFYRGAGDVGWLPGLSPLETLGRFGRYYVLTSLAWDSFRAFGDAVAIVVLGTPVLAALGRMRARLGYEIVEDASA